MFFKILYSNSWWNHFYMCLVDGGNRNNQRKPIPTWGEKHANSTQKGYMIRESNLGRLLVWQKCNHSASCDNKDGIRKKWFQLTAAVNMSVSFCTRS